ncbi:hypothetical protein AADZ86_00910 [Colwelliaceae bacterium BS250]
MSDIIKKASKYLQETIQDLNPNKLGSSHAHAAISGALGYKSKKALLADNYNSPIEDEFILYSQGGKLNNSLLAEVIDRMKDSPLKSLPSHVVSSAISEALTPECEHCGDKNVYSQPLFSSNDIEEPIAQVCHSCSDDREEYDTCLYCGEGTLYRSSEINSAGECSEHQGEGSFSDEEREGWDSYIENVTKDL